MFRGVVDMSYGEVDSAAGSMYVQVRRTSQLHRMPRHRPPTVSGDSVRLISKKTAKFTQRFIHKLLISKALRYGPYVCNEGITQFYLPPTHEPAFTPQPHRRHRHLSGTHCAYRRRDSQAELTWVAGHISR